MKKNAHFILTFMALISQCAVGQVCVDQLSVPKYPPVAWVDLVIKIGTQGHVVSVEGSGSAPVLAEGAKKNVGEWVFCAPEHQESAHVRLRFEYRLEGARVYRSPTPKVVIDLRKGTVAISLPPAEPQP